MELYTLDEQLRRNEVVEGYEALIWTERYTAWGDFELVMKSSRQARDLLPAGTNLALNKSHRIMTVETVEDTVNTEGEQTLTISGRSFEAIFDDRVAFTSLAPLEKKDPTDPEGQRMIAAKWDIKQKPVDAIKTLFNTICVTKKLSSGDGVPFYKAGSVFPLGTIPAPSEVTEFAFEPDTLYNSIKKIADTYNLGFRLVRNYERSEVMFEVYTGDDRTSGQTVRPAVIFSPELDNLSNTTELTSDAQYKNVAYVFGKKGSAIVYAPGADPSAEGVNRRVLFVRADNIDLEAGDALTVALNQRGLEELANHRKVYNFDGEIQQNSSLVYGVDYNLGDLVEQRNAEGYSNEMRVTEQIFVSDNEGERAYPTLSLNVTSTPGSWSSWGAKVWAEVDLDIYWANAHSVE